MCSIGRNGERWRGGQRWADEGANWRARVLAEASMVRDVTFAKSLFSGAIVGDAVVLRVTDPVDSLTVAEVRDSTSACPTDQGAQVARGNFFPAYIPDSLRYE
jgi:hypothetical protein